MATLAQLEDRVRRKLGLDTGNHTIVCNAADPTNGDIITINDVDITIHGTETNKASATLNTTPNTMAANLNTAINAIFSSASGVTSTVDTATVTILGARTLQVTQTNVAFSISTASTEDSPPFTSDIDEFIKEGQLDIANKVADNVFLADGTSSQNMVIFNEIDTSSGGSANVYNAPTDLLRIVELQCKTAIGGDTIQRAEQVPYDLLLDIRNGSHPFYKVYGSAPVNGRYFSVFSTDSANAGKPRLEFSQTLAAHATDALHLIYIRLPQEVRATECSLPAFLENLVIDYAAAQCLMQLGQANEGMAMLGVYNQTIESINQRYIVTESQKPNILSFERPN
jgi:hypothetical protein